MLDKFIYQLKNEMLIQILKEMLNQGLTILLGQIQTSRVTLLKKSY